LKNLLKLLGLLALVGTLTTGCAINRATATVDPTAKLDTIKSIQVTKFEKDERNVNVLIADNLRKRGYQVTTDKNPPSPVDAVVTYVDKWWWDITMYMLELTIVVRDPKTEYPLATGNSLHTSLTRKSAPEMVDEVIGNILKQGTAK
jgi:hypothetical protein